MTSAPWRINLFDQGIHNVRFQQADTQALMTEVERIADVDQRRS